MFKINMKYFVFACITALIYAHILFAQNEEMVSNLEGLWKFSIGDDMNWAKMSFDDRGWDEIRVPSAWENEGYHGYDGYAWYRKKVYIPREYQNRALGIKLGRVDDVDEVFINEKMIGKTGNFPPDYNSAYSVYRDYVIPNTVIRYNDWNLIAIRVFDSEQLGGMLDSGFYIYAKQNIIFPMMSLESTWKFNTGDNKEWKDENFDDSKWKEILVPANWEHQGYPDYDGYAWYRKKFVPFSDLEGKKLVLMVGKIDDYDEVYLNGVKIGSTGKIDNPTAKLDANVYKYFRGYYLPDGLLKFNKENVIAVRVYDGWRYGGIYSGPVGFTTQQKYIQFWRDEKKNQKSFLEKFFFGE